MNLYEIKETTIDYILSLSEVERLTYYSTLIDKFYPTISKETHEFERLLSAYETSFVGLLRNSISDLYFTDDDLITH